MNHKRPIRLLLCVTFLEDDLEDETVMMIMMMMIEGFVLFFSYIV